MFVENFRQGVAERLDIGYETLREINPMIVYGSATGYGPNGPDSAASVVRRLRTGARRADDLGHAGGRGGAGAGVPGRLGPDGRDNAVPGVLAALVARHIQGRGQKVDASHLSANMWLQGMGMTMGLIMGGDRFGAYDRKSPGTCSPICTSVRMSAGFSSCTSSRTATGSRS